MVFPVIIVVIQLFRPICSACLGTPPLCGSSLLTFPLLLSVCSPNPELWRLMLQSSKALAFGSPKLLCRWELSSGKKLQISQSHQMQFLFFQSRFFSSFCPLWLFSSVSKWVFFLNHFVQTLKLLSVASLVYPRPNSTIK